MSKEKAIERVLKVNHAGEYGAIRIYKAQLVVAKLFYKDLIPFLSHTLEHEVEHCQKFRQAMIPREIRPCYTVWLWSWGGYFLGLVTALMGRNLIMVCTEAVEDTVHRHMEEQIEFMDRHDLSLKTLIEDIQKEELQHLTYAQSHVTHNRFTKLMSCIIGIATEFLIWLSTQGASTRMKKDLTTND